VNEITIYRHVKQITMLYNYLKSALRSFRNNRTTTVINLAGLSIGLATCLLILLFIGHELGYDRFNVKADRIERVFFGGVVKGDVMNESTVMPPVAATMKAECPEVEDATRLRDYEKPKIVVNNQTFRDNTLAFVDANFFEVFTLPFVAGDPATALNAPNRVVVSVSCAKKFFGNNDPIGQIIKLPDNKQTLEVVGVMRDIPHNSHFQFDLLASTLTLPEGQETNWMQSNFYTYVVLRKGANRAALEKRLPGLVEKYMGPQMKEAMGMSLAQFREQGNDLRFGLQPLTDIYLYSDFPRDLAKKGDIRYVWIFAAIGAFMLLIACINFINLSTASASRRAREVGVRKAVGSSRGALVGQFLTESVLLSSIAMSLAVGLASLALPLVRHFSGLPLAFNWAGNWAILPALAGFALFTGILAGAYPAFFMASFRPEWVLKGNAGALLSGAGSKGHLRNGLVVFQFILSVALIICTAIVYHQLRFVQETPLGYDRESVLVLPDPAALGTGKEAFLAQLRQDTRIEQWTLSTYLPAGPTGDNNFFIYPEGRQADVVKTLRYDVDERYCTTLGIKLAAGRYLAPDKFPGDSSAIVLNEAASMALGWGENPVGQRLNTQLKRGRQSTYEVVGMVKNFHFRSLYERISPLVMVVGTGGNAIVKVNGNAASAVADHLKNEWAKHSDEPFTYSFLDDRVRETYRAERAFGLMLVVFTGLTIFVACLGLFGLAIFTAERRTKEIGIRKVLGASITSITSLLAKDFLKLVLIAIVIASPVAYYFMNRWLSDFAYRIEMQWWVFVAAGALAVVIAFLTVGGQAVKAALANPVKSLRSE
jgi:putative ABC transport system permease protein